MQFEEVISIKKDKNVLLFAEDFTCQLFTCKLLYISRLTESLNRKFYQPLRYGCTGQVKNKVWEQTQ